MSIFGKPTMKAKSTRIFEIIEYARKQGIVQQFASIPESSIKGKVNIKGQDLYNFSSCSYLNLEKEPSILNAMIEAIKVYGSQFSSSRAYLSIDLYQEYEDLLSQIMEMPVMITPSVTLGHLSNIPVLIDPEKDLVIIDQQVHNSVKSALTALQTQGLIVDVLRHNRMDLLEEKLFSLSDKYRKVWYLADGVYSMYGDLAPFEMLKRFLNDYQNFNCYIDDAHGFGWCGEGGSGVVLSKLNYHPRLFLCTSLNKSFAAAGGAFAYPNESKRQLVRNCGGTMTFSGPIQPAMIAAGIASAKFHLSDRLKPKQQQLMELIKHFIEKAKSLKLPLVDASLTPIFYIGVGKKEIGYFIVKQLMKKGFFVNLAIFPAVSEGRTGLRIPISIAHSKSIIDNLLESISEEINNLTKDNQFNLEKNRRIFGI